MVLVSRVANADQIECGKYSVHFRVSRFRFQLKSGAGPLTADFYGATCFGSQLPVRAKTT
jgi:hypothetical protein